MISPLALALAVVVASSATATRPQHILTAPTTGSPFLRQIAPDYAGVESARTLAERAARAARVESGQRGLDRAAVETAGSIVEAVSGVLRRGYGHPVHPFRFREGRLDVPVQGTVQATFGRRPLGRTGAVERHSGWSIAVAPSAIVRAVAPGVVVVHASVPGMQEVVVIDHGDQFHTVYARLSSATVPEGAAVDAGTPVGVAHGGPHTVYFEIRDQGIPVDPARWIRLSPTERSAAEVR